MWYFKSKLMIIFSGTKTKSYSLYKGREEEEWSSWRHDKLQIEKENEASADITKARFEELVPALCTGPL